MRLTSLTINGFKSFGHRATLEFAPGVTAIVGPNGSGKSNVIDALRWATGGGRASEFRAGEKTELIFHGADGKKSQSYAEVEIELERDGRPVHITRNLYRDGQSRLRLGGKNARFLDLEEELAGSGLGKSGLALIGQGEVSQVLMADPAKLLGYVAEAAGIGAFAARREQTHARLEAARDHLTRLQDVLGELRRRQKELQAEAAQAERASSLSRDALQLRYTLSSRRVLSLESEVAGLREQEARLAEALEAGREELGAARRNWQEARAALAGTEEAYRRTLALAEARRGDLRVAQERRDNLEARQRSLEDEDRRLQSELAALEGVRPPGRPEGEEGVLQAALNEAAAKRSAQQQELAEQERRLQEAASRLEGARRQQAIAEEALKAFEKRKVDLEGALKAVVARMEELPRAQEALLEGQEARRQELQELLAKKTGVAGTIRGALANMQQAHAHAAAEHRAAQRTAARMRSDFESRRGYAQGPREALSSGIPGVVGSVADLIRVPPEFEVAIASALGRRAENVVVDSAATAQEVVAHLKRTGGWATLLPLDLLQPRRATLDPSLEGAPGVLGLASRLVEAETRFEPVVAQLLGGTLVVENMAQAVALARRFRQRPRFVTLEGDLLEPSGAISGGRRQVHSGILGLAGEVEEAERAALQAGESAKVQAAELQARQQDFHALENSRRGLEVELRRLENDIAQRREKQAARNSLAAELRARRAELEAALSGLAEPEAANDAELEGFEAAHSEALARVELSRGQLQQAAEEQAKIRQGHALFQERLRSYEQALQAYEEGRARLAKLQARGRELAEELRVAAGSLQQAHEAVREAEAAMPCDLAAKEEEFKGAGRRSAGAEAALASLTQDQAEHGRQLEEVRLALARREASLEQAREELGAFPAGLCHREGLPRALRDALASAERELEAIGPVNHRAAQDFLVVQGRIEELLTQGNDAEMAAQELEGVLADIDRETDSRLGAAMDRLRHAFARHAAELFGESAEAGIEVHRDEGRPSGLAIRLRPPGKKTRSLNLLSVGERTMGALAFLFSLMSEGEGQRLPIAILDEVDAPLDEANIRRFRDFLRRLAARGTQFILITHQKATMEAADVLWGVTSERGVSRLFSIQRPAEAVLT